MIWTTVFEKNIKYILEILLFFKRILILEIIFSLNIYKKNCIFVSSAITLKL